MNYKERTYRSWCVIAIMVPAHPGEIKVAEEIHIPRADDDDLLTANLKYKFECCGIFNDHCKRYDMPVADPEGTFQALLDVRTMVYIKSLHQLDLRLLSGEDGAVGTVYEGSQILGRYRALSRLTIVDIQNGLDFKYLELSLKHTPQERGITSRETWSFEVRRHPESGSWVLVFCDKHISGMSRNEELLCMIPSMLVTVFLLALALALLPLTIVARDAKVREQKNRIVPLYRYLLEYDPETRTRNELGER